MRIWSHLLKKSLMGNFIFLQWIVNELVKENVLLLENNSVPHLSLESIIILISLTRFMLIPRELNLSSAEQQ